MTFFSRGLDAEDRIVSKLRSFGCDIKTDPQLDHQQKLDFVILKFPEVPTFFSIGVQVTSNCDNVEKMELFLKVQSNSKVTQKAAFLELADNVDLESGGAMTAFVALAASQLDRSLSENRIIGIRIHPDCTFQFFNLSERLRQLKQTRSTVAEGQTAVSAVSHGTLARHPISHQPSSGLGSVLGAKLQEALKSPSEQDSPSNPDSIRQGVLTTVYPRKGYGFIRGTNGVDSTHYLFFRNIKDEKLLEIWNSYRMRERADVDLPVSFLDAGQTRKDAKYPEAVEVTLIGGQNAGGEL